MSTILTASSTAVLGRMRVAMTEHAKSVDIGRGGPAQPSA